GDLAGFMTKLVGLILGLQQDLGSELSTSLLSVKAPQRAHDQRPKQACLTFARNAKHLIEGGFRLFKIAAYHLYDPATVVGGDHIIGAVVRFGQDTRFLGA